MTYVLLWLGFAIVAGVIASAKNRSGFGYFVLGLLLPLIGVLLAIGMPARAKPEPPMSLADFKKCPMCAEMIKREAIRCRYCSADLGAPATVIAYAVDGDPVSPVAAALASGQVSVVRPLPHKAGRCPRCSSPREQFDLGCTNCGSKQAAIFKG